MLVPPKDFSYKSAMVGAIIGASIGLGMISIDMAFSLAIVFALLFGYRNPQKSTGRSEQLRSGYKYHPKRD